MNRHDFTLRKNIRTLKRLKTQILVLSGELEGCIVRHTNSRCPKEPLNGNERERSQVQAKQNSVHRDVYLHLALAGNDGLTSGEVLRLLEAKRKVSRDAVRQALNRMRKAGTARRLGTLWHLI
jgi:hypothetical protein